MYTHTYIHTNTGIRISQKEWQILMFLSLKVAQSTLLFKSFSYFIQNILLLHILLLKLSNPIIHIGLLLVAQTAVNLPAIRETWVWSLGQEVPLEKGLAIHSGILDWRIPWTEEPSGLQSMGPQRAGHN